MSDSGKIILGGLSFVVLFISAAIFLCNGLVLALTEKPKTEHVKSFPFISASLVSIFTSN